MSDYSISAASGPAPSGQFSRRARRGQRREISASQADPGDRESGTVCRLFGLRWRSCEKIMVRGSHNGRTKTGERCSKAADPVNLSFSAFVNVLATNDN